MLPGSVTFGPGPGIPGRAGKGISVAKLKHQVNHHRDSLRNFAFPVIQIGSAVYSQEFRNLMMISKSLFKFHQSRIHSGRYYRDIISHHARRFFRIERIGLHCYKEAMETNGDKLQRILIEILEAERKRSGIKGAKLGQLVWPCHADSRKIFKNMVEGTRSISLSEFYDICVILKIYPERILARALDRLEESAKK
jgi:hypothetical protein